LNFQNQLELIDPHSIAKNTIGGISIKSPIPQLFSFVMQKAAFFACHGESGRRIFVPILSR
jgi:hypothetical protein